MLVWLVGCKSPFVLWDSNHLLWHEQQHYVGQLKKHSLQTPPQGPTTPLHNFTPLSGWMEPWLEKKLCLLFFQEGWMQPPTKYPHPFLIDLLLLCTHTLIALPHHMGMMLCRDMMIVELLSCGDHHPQGQLSTLFGSRSNTIMYCLGVEECVRHDNHLRYNRDCVYKNPPPKCYTLN